MKRRALRKRYGRAKTPSHHEVRRHERALEMHLTRVNSDLAMLRELERGGRESLVAARDEHVWLMAHCKA